ncbi:hypothetical protein [Methylobacter sp.]|uniref:hypothetical protein n=1 Tax=Methylobacter sp. TaxID=2051955 RepID=UPI0011FAC254|nr:hypothetical protein [Methylobacter sp.]TAK59522.1 MAG: hypothetical protein EPO18_20385 [Methylobacter sp.]
MTDKQMLDWLIKRFQYNDYDWSEGHAASYQTIAILPIRTSAGDDFGVRRLRGRAAIRRAMLAEKQGDRSEP